MSGPLCPPPDTKAPCRNARGFRFLLTGMGRGWRQTPNREHLFKPDTEQEATILDILTNGCSMLMLQNIT